MMLTILKIIQPATTNL